jgi:hypothetical protein
MHGCKSSLHGFNCGGSLWQLVVQLAGADPGMKY